ncbi:hypothetical protein HZS_5746 [Henneguya salminicola]|nr:hypothetical protein HZS_5746 [Henneguya salminicola]
MIQLTSTLFLEKIDVIPLNTTQSLNFLFHWLQTRRSTDLRAFIEFTSSIKRFINIIDFKPVDGVLHDPLIPGNSPSLSIVSVNTKSLLYIFSRTQTKKLDFEHTVTERIYKTDPNLELGTELT